MIDRFLFFLKLFAGLLCWLCVAVAAIGAISTKDTFFVVCGVVAILTLAYNGCRFMSKHSGSINTNNE